MAHAHAATPCDVGALSALAVDGVTIVSATHDKAGACGIVGTLNTSLDAPPGSAGFQLRLPDAWNRKFVFFGVGGFGGNVTDPSANPADLERALARGYASIVTDTGHQGGSTDASWALIRPGVPAAGKLADYLYRATHEVTLAGKALVERFYGQPIVRAYFDGCSNGGHQGMTEAADYPSDYDGIVAGAPLFDDHVFLGGLHFQQREVSSPAAYLSAAKLQAVAASVLKSCDAADGVSDGLIQNPAACDFDPTAMICTGADGDGCLTTAQAGTVRTYLSAAQDAAGGYVYAGWSVSALAAAAAAWNTGTTKPTDFSAAEPWGNAGYGPAPLGWQFVDHAFKFMISQQPDFDVRRFARGAGGRFSQADIAMVDTRLGGAGAAQRVAGFNASPHAYAAFLEGHGKLLMYHGLADAAISPFSTMRLYEAMAGIMPGGYARLAQSARLFLVPGMEHCSGGDGPNSFDTLAPLEQWVEQGVPPDRIGAVHHAGDDGGKPVDRSMVLCAFPRQAVFSGRGNVKDAANWSCADNARMLQVGVNGRQGGL